MSHTLRIRRVVGRIVRAPRYLAFRAKQRRAARRGSGSYWSVHMVSHECFDSATDSLAHLEWRNSQYPGYIELMPVNDLDGFTVLDYGCGPGNDLVGVGTYSKPARLVGADVSVPALKAASRRLALHGIEAEFLHIEEQDNRIPLDDGSVDVVHSSGVLHHAHDLPAAIRDIHRILRPGGRLRVMVYNYESLWVHLYVAYMHQILKPRFQDLTLAEAFRRSTDGPDCPISHCYRPNDFVKIVTDFGFDGRFTGAAISLTELSLLPRRFEAIGDRRLPSEHRRFLERLVFDERGHPRVGGHVAGIDACYEFVKRED